MSTVMENQDGDTTRFVPSGYDMTTADVPDLSKLLGGPYYVEHHPEIAVPYLILAGLLVVVGVIGNICILCTVRLHKPLRRNRNIFVINLAIADLSVSGIANSFGIVGMLQGKPFFVNSPVLCDLVGTLCLAACVTALLSIGAVGFSQYICICHTAVYSRIFTLRNNVIICLVFWLIGLGFASPALLGWTENVYDDKYLECIWNRKSSLTFNIFFCVGIVFTPVIIIAYSYIRICWRFYSSRKNVGQSASNKSSRDAYRLARSLSFAFVAFVICWTPYAVVVVADFEDKLPLAFHLFVLLLAHAHASLNSIIYGVSNLHFRKGYGILFAKVFMCGKSNKISDTNSSSDWSKTADLVSVNRTSTFGTTPKL